MNANDIEKNIEREVSLIPARLPNYSKEIVIESLNFLPIGYGLLWEGVIQEGDLIWDYSTNCKWEVQMDSDIGCLVSDYWVVARVKQKVELDENTNPYLPMDGLK